MSNYGTLLLSKVIDDNNVQVLAKHNVTAEHFKSDVDRKAYEFIRDYAEQNRGQAPSYAAVTEAVPGFFHVPEVYDSYEYITKKLFNDVAATDFATFVNAPNGLMALFNEHQGDMKSFFDRFSEKMYDIKTRTDVREKVGMSVKYDGDQFLTEYQKRKEGKSFKIWKSSFSNIGEYISGNMYTVYGKSGRGKSVIAAIKEAVTLAMQGAIVLEWSMEMPTFEVFVRLYVEISGRTGVTSAVIDGIMTDAGFDADALRKGQMTPEFEQAFRDFIAEIGDLMPGDIIVRGVDDAGFTVRTVRQIEADILQTHADVVIIDPFYYLQYEKNTSKTTGGDASNTSMKLRQITGTRQVVTIAITQAEEVKATTDEEGNRELSLPDRSEVKKTSQLLEDATILIAVDTDNKQGRGLVGVNKGRNGGEGDVVEILYVPQVGVVREIETGAGSVAQFDF